MFTSLRFVDIESKIVDIFYFAKSNRIEIEILISSHHYFAELFCFRVIVYYNCFGLN